MKRRGVRGGRGERFLALVLAGAWACGGHSPPPERAEEVERPATLPAEPGGQAGAGRDAPSRPRRQGEVERADLNRVLDAGESSFLARGEVKARLVKGQFTGWEVVRTPFPEIDLVPGDVVLSVNGRTLEHPVDLNRLWIDLRAANAIDVTVERGGGRFALRFTVVPPL